MSIQVNIGQSGSGKTYALMREVERTAMKGEHRFIVLDRLREWADSGGESAIGFVDVGVVRSSEEMQKALATDLPVIIFQPTVMLGGSVDDEIAKAKTEPDPTERAAVSLARETIRQLWRKDDSKDQRRGILVTPEAHYFAKNGGRLYRSLDELAGAYRHHGAGWWVDTQRPSLLHKRVTEQASILRIFPMSGARDRKVVHDEWGAHILDMLEVANDRMANGEPGWHVRLEPLSTDGAVLARYVYVDKKGEPVDKKKAYTVGVISEEGKPMKADAQVEIEFRR